MNYEIDLPDELSQPEQEKKEQPFREQTLLIISHTEHYLTAAGAPSGWIPTVREIDFLAQHFKKVIHLAVLQSGEVPKSTTTYSASNVTFQSIPPFGGAGILKKLKILWVIPQLLWKVQQLLRQADLYQFRAPTSIGIFLIPYLSLFSNKKGWYKYAGNWEQPHMPLSYKIQKKLLQHFQKRPVTVNGKWPNQPIHIHAFENPCLNAAELPAFRETATHKSEIKGWVGCFVGRLDDAKGVHRIVELLQHTASPLQFTTFHFVGDGPKRAVYEETLNNVACNVIFHGFAPRDETFAIYAKSHFIVLPSDSEGFPKVIAEAAAFGCVPIVSDVSSIGQYVQPHNGYLWPIGKISFTDFIAQQHWNHRIWRAQSEAIYRLAERFTFEHYLKQLKSLLK